MIDDVSYMPSLSVAWAMIHEFYGKKPSFVGIHEFLSFGRVWMDGLFEVLIVLNGLEG